MKNNLVLCVRVRNKNNRDAFFLEFGYYFPPRKLTRPRKLTPPQLSVVSNT